MEVDREHAVPVVERRLGDGLVRPDRRVAHEDVDGSQLGEPLPDHRVHRRGVGDVGEDGDGAHARLPTLGGDALQLVAIRPRVQHEVRTLGRERQRDRPADVAARAGDERGLPPESHS
ncbi:MAG: hypothetical protein AUF63_01185 [Candidatus Rokubacteria bacterium 13_1_20CM_70_15]|nr:MAG: hypothetical protein AUF63_01185 [Candidatus Rokubacteria bacterium 13_1_20CM_70_15]